MSSDTALFKFDNPIIRGEEGTSGPIIITKIIHLKPEVILTSNLALDSSSNVV